MLIQRTKERIFLDESRFNNSRLKKLGPLEEQRFLLEMDTESRIKLEKIKKDPNIPLYLNGPIQAGDKVNRNRRIYPWQYLKAECIRYMEEEIADKQSYGELDHPEDSTTPSLKNAALTIEDIWFKDKEVWGRVKVLNAFEGPDGPGRKSRSIVLNGKTLGISSRALGSLEEHEDHDEVCEDLALICWDFVSRPSTHTANMQMEKKMMGEGLKKYITESQYNENRNQKLQTLTEVEQTCLQILGIEEFLKVYKKF